MFSVIIFGVLTAIASIAHGGNYAPKILIVLMHAVASLILCGVWYALSAGLWWVLFRRGTHAKAELDYLTDKGGLDAVRQAYIWPIGIGAAWIVELCKTRRQQEFLLGAFTGLVLGILSFILTFIFNS